MKLLLSLFVILVSSIPTAAQEFQSVRPTVVVPPAAIANRGPVLVWNTPRPAWAIRLPAAPPLLLQGSVRLPSLLLFHTPRGLRGFVIEGSVALPIGGQTPSSSIFTPTWGLWDAR